MVGIGKVRKRPVKEQKKKRSVGRCRDSGRQAERHNKSKERTRKKDRGGLIEMAKRVAAGRDRGGGRERFEGVCAQKEGRYPD